MKVDMKRNVMSGPSQIMEYPSYPAFEMLIVNAPVTELNCPPSPPTEN